MEVLKSNSGQEFIILEEGIKPVRNRTYMMCTIQFVATGTIKTVYKSNADCGKVKDPYQVSFCGVGYLGDYTRSPHWRQSKQLWTNMIKRCYDQNYVAGYYGRGYTVCERWKCFSNFLDDVQKLPNFGLWLLGHEKGNTKYNLDKDLTIPNNKVYCREACSFVTESLNKAAGARNGKPYTKKKKVGMA